MSLEINKFFGENEKYEVNEKEITSDWMLQLNTKQLNWAPLLNRNYSYCSEIVKKAIDDQKIDIVVYDFCFKNEESHLNENVLRKICTKVLNTLDDFDVSVEYKKLLNVLTKGARRYMRN
jgi:hypothetical protein